MIRLIKKYKNRRLYDTHSSQYITIEQLQRYVVDGFEFKVEDSDTGKDLTNAILLQIIVDMEAGPSQFLSSEILRQIIALANHPMNQSLKTLMEHMFLSMKQPTPSNPFDKVSETWNKQLHDITQQWQKIFK